MTAIGAIDLLGIALEACNRGDKQTVVSSAWLSVCLTLCFKGAESMFPLRAARLAHIMLEHLAVYSRHGSRWTEIGFASQARGI